MPNKVKKVYQNYYLSTLLSDLTFQITENDIVDYDKPDFSLEVRKIGELFVATVKGSEPEED